MTDKDTGKAKGYGFVEFADAATAESAVRNLNGREIGGRSLRVDYAEHPDGTRVVVGTRRSGPADVRGGCAFVSSSLYTLPDSAEQLLARDPRNRRGPPRCVRGLCEVSITRRRALQHEPVGASTASAALPLLPHPFASPQPAVADALSGALGGASPASLASSLGQFRALAQLNPQQARAILVANPPLCRALLQAQVLMGMLADGGAAPPSQLPPQQHLTPPAPPPAPAVLQPIASAPQLQHHPSWPPPQPQPQQMMMGVPQIALQPMAHHGMAHADGWGHTAPSGASPALGLEQQQALLAQVMNLTEVQVAALPAAERQQVRLLQQLARQQQSGAMY